MKADLRLFPLNIRSVSGTDIPDEVFDEYEGSDRCKDAIERKIMLGGLTHFTRDMPEDMKGKVGIDDPQLLDGNVTHYISKIWRGDDGYVYCTITLLNPNDFDEKMANNIKRLRGYLKSGVKLGVSVVVDSITDKLTGKSSQLLAIIGVDITMNPAFKRTEVVRIYEDEED